MVDPVVPPIPTSASFESSIDTGTTNIPTEDKSSRGDASTFSDLSDTVTPPQVGVPRRSTTGQDPSLIESNVLRRRLLHVDNSDDSMRSSSDFFKLNFDVGLVGRDEQVETIQDVVRKVAQRDHADKHVLLVRGPSGIGKTSLAGQGLRLASKMKCLVGKGKFALTDTNEPLAVVKTALSQIAQQISDEMFHQQIRDTLDKEILNMLMPGLLLEAKDSNESSPTESSINEDNSLTLSQLRYATVTLLSMMTAPVVLMIDDAQWADKTSLQLLTAWATEESLRHLVLVVCFRDEELSDDHPLTQVFLQPLENHTEGKSRKMDDMESDTNMVHIHELSVQGLTVPHIQVLLSDLLRRPEKETFELAEFFHKKTLGNPFYVISFVKSLVDESLLSFNLGAMKWQWDLEVIRKNTSAAENVVDLVRQKLAHCQEAQAVLPVAAILGANFTISVLEMVLMDIRNDATPLEIVGLQSIPRTEKELRDFLDVCEVDGYVDRLEGSHESSYRFVHDQIQAAALASLPSIQLVDLQFLVGKFLAHHLDNEDTSQKQSSTTRNKDHTLFTAVNLLNAQAGRILDDDALRMQVIRLNLLAGKDALETASFSTASSYFLSAIDILPTNSWEIHQQLSTEIYSKAAQATYCAGEPSRTNEYCGIILSQDNVPLLDKVPAYHLLMQLRLAEERHEEGIEIALDLLKKLGITFPKNKTLITLSTISGLLKTKRIARKLSDQNIETLPIVSDLRGIAIVKTLDMLVTATYVCRQELTFLAIHKVVHQSLKVGLTAYSSVAFALLGLIMVAVLEDFATARACYDRALFISKRLGSTHVEARLDFILHEYLFSWFAPQQNCLPFLAKAYRSGLMSGDLESFGWAMVFFIENSMHAARTLTLVDADCSVYAKQLETYAQLKQRRFVLYLWQATWNFIGKNNGGSVLCGDIVNRDEEMIYLNSINDPSMPVALKRTEMFVAIIMGDYKRCADIALEWADECLKRIPAQSANIRVRYYAALSCLVMAQREPSKYKRYGMKNASIINSWTKKGNPNCLHMDTLLDAERARVGKQSHAAIKAYESAVVLAGKCGMLHEQALASERYADLLVSLERNDEARQRLNDAVTLMSEWGATAKVDQLRRRLSVL